MNNGKAIRFATRKPNRHRKGLGMGTYIIRDVFNLLRERWRKGLGMERYTEDALMSDMILCLRELDSHVQPNTCRVLAKLATDYTKQLADAQAAVEALEALQRERSAIEKVLDIDSGKTTVEKVVDLKRSFAQVWESYQDAANEMFEAQTQLSQLQALVRAIYAAPNMNRVYYLIDDYRATLDATTPAKEER